MTAPFDPDERIGKYVDAIRYGLLPAQLRDVLAQITDANRRLLAVQRYLHKIEKKGWRAMQGKWAWTDTQFEAWRGSAEDHALSRELAEIRRRFEADNPGVRLVRGSKHRSLHQQIHNWNKNWSVEVNAIHLLAKVRKEIQRPGVYPDLGPYLDQQRGLLSLVLSPVVVMPGTPTLRPEWEPVVAFKEFLSQRFYYSTKFMVATPGLSDHGQARAIDFRIVKRATGATVVGASNKAKWDSEGWTTRLREAARPSRHFVAELAHEPWHYSYRP